MAHGKKCSYTISAQPVTKREMGKLYYAFPMSIPLNSHRAMWLAFTEETGQEVSCVPSMWKLQAALWAPPSSFLLQQHQQCCVSPSEVGNEEQRPSRHPGHHRVSRKHKQQQQLWRWKNRRVKKWFLDVCFYFCMWSLSPNVLSDSFVVFLWSEPSHYVQKQTTLVSSPPKNQRRGR